MAINREQLSQFMGRAQALQAEVANFQETMNRTEVTGTAAGGDVAVTVTAGGEFLSVHLDPALIDECEADELERLLLTALRDAAGQLRDRAAERTGPLTAALDGLRTR
ncbi:hypothetical protein GCM10023322_08340 [Rugosimonospora acidiphila]|uniref:Nucleoid-associated protein GCM10023322_08340 n=1 Tax=Rugosimonospora acidiphila TaxID=556531 RepID=A0ABP9RL06_9ACTN